MASFSEYQSKLDKKYKKEEEQKKSQSTSTSTGGGGTSSSTNRYKDVSSRLDEKYLISSLDGNGVGNWFDEAQSIVSGLQNSKHSEYTTYGKADTEKIQSLLDSSDEVRKYIHANKSAFQNYEDMYNGFTQLKSALSTAKKAQKYYSQFESEDDYNKASMGWLSDDAEFTTESVSKRKSQYQSNLDRIAEIEAQLAAGAEPSDDDKPWWEKILGYLGGVQDTTLPMSTSNVKPSEKDSALLTERDALKAENLQYERLQKALDDYYSPVTPHFAANAAYRDYANPTKEDLWNYDMSALEGSDVLTRGGYFDEEGNIRNSDGNIVQYANAPTIEDKLGMFLSASDEELTEAYNRLSVTNGNYTDTWANLMQEGDVNGWEHLKEEEINTYYNLLKTRGQAEAYKFLEAMTPTLTRRATQANTDYINNEASLLEMIALNVASVPMNVFGGVAGLVDDVSNIVQGKDIDPYSRAHSLTNMAGDVRNKTAESIDEWTGGAAIPWVDFSFGDAYQAGMSFADSALAMATGTWVGEGLLATGAATSEMRDLYERGATADQMIAGGILAGAAEAVFEHISIGELKKLKNMDNKAVKNLFDGFVRTTIMGGVEASEEMATEIANAISDALVMGSQSDWVDTETFLKNVVNAGIGGFLSGGIGGAIASKANNAQYNQKVAQHGQAIIDEGGTDALWQLALEMSGDKSALDAKKLGKLAGKVDSKASAKNVGRLSVQMESTISGQNRAEIEKALADKGLSEKEAKRVAEYLGSNQTLTAEQKTEIEGNEKIKSVVTELLEDPKSNISARTRNLFYARQGYSTTNVSTNTSKSGKIEVNAEANVKEKISESGTTSMKTKDGKIVSLTIDKSNPIAKTEMVKNEKGESERIVYFNTDKGKVSSADVLYATEEEGLLYESFVDMNPAFANAVIKNYDGSVPLQTYIRGMREGIIVYGMHNFQAVGKDISKGSFLASLSEANQNFALKLGRAYAKSDAKKADQALRSAVKNAREKAEADKASSDGATQNKPKKGGVTFEKGVHATTKAQRRVAYLAKHLAKAIGINIVFYDARTTTDKKGQGKNGYFNRTTNEIHLDIQNAKSDAKTIAFTLSHELVHFIRNNSETQFNTFSKFLMEQYASHGVDTSKLLAKKMAELGTDDADRAYEEMIADACETMLLDSNAVVKLMKLREADLNLFETIKLHILELLQKIRAEYKRLGLEPTSDEAKALLQMGDALEQIHTKFEDALVEATENYQASIGSRNLEDFAEAKTTDGDVLFQYKAIKADESAYREMLSKWGKMSDTQINNLFLTIDKAVAIIKDNLEALDYAWEADIDDRAFSPVKPNSDKLYQVSLDFSTLCRKRILQQMVQAQLQEALNKPLTREEGIAIRDALIAIQEEGRQIEVACALCYVESARMKSPAQIEKFLKNRESVLKEFFAGKSGGSMKAKINQAEADAKEKLHRENPNGIKGKDGVTMLDPRNSPLKALPKKYADEIRAAKRSAKESYAPTAEEQSLIDVAKGMTVSDFTSPEGLENLAKNYPRLFDAYTSYVRNATKSKGIENDTWWRAGDSMKIGDVLIANMNRENGLRSQSWSDFQVVHILDYIAATIELATRNAKEQAYTKVPDYAELMGNTGVMINLSLIPTASFKGSLEYDSVEGMAYKRALELRDKYHATVGTICIGIDNVQIKMLLGDITIDYVIPYHKSGMAAHIRKAMHIPTWSQYEEYQSESNLSRADAERQAKKYGVGLLDKSDPNYQKAPIFSEWFDIKEARQIAKMENANPTDKARQEKYGVMYGGYMAMQNAANNYLKLCAERGLSPKFSHEKADFTAEENYWKLLIDRKMVDNVTGEVIEQQTIKPIFDESEILRILNDELDRYPGVKADQEYAVRKVTEAYLSGSLRGGMSAEAIAKVMKTPVDNVTTTNIIATAKEIKEFDSSKEKIEQNIEDIAKMSSVYDVDKSKLEKTGKRPSDTFAEYFEEWGNRLYSDELGDIAVEKSSIKSEIRHGLTAEKIASIEAIPAVVKEGKVIFSGLKPNSDVQRIVVCAPIKIGNAPYYMGVMLQRDTQTQRLYLHNVAIEKEASEISQADLLTTGADESNEHLFVTSILQNALAVKYQNAQNADSVKRNFSESDTENSDTRDQKKKVSNRDLLANALESAVQNDIERNKLAQYKSKLATIELEQAKLADVRQQANDLRFKKGRTAEETKALKSLDFEANQIANRINTYDRQLFALEATSALKGVLQREKELVRKRTEEKGREALDAYREKMTKTQRELLGRASESRKRAVERVRESRDKGEAKVKLQKLILKTIKWLSYPAKEDVKCPDILKEPYAEFLKSIDLSSNRLLKGGDPTQNDLRLASAMDSLATAIERIKTAQNPNVTTDQILDSGYLDLPENFVELLRTMAEDIKNKMTSGNPVVNDINSTDVKAITKLIRTLNHAIKEMSTLYANLRFANVGELGDHTISFLEDMGELESTNGVKDFVGWDNALPYYAFKRFGDGGESIFEGFMDAQDKLAHLASKIFAFKDKTWTDKEAKAWGEDTHTIELPSGNTLTLTTADAMSIYCLSRRDNHHGMDHLLGGGVRVIGIQKGSKKAADSRSHLSEDDVMAIASSLTDRQKAVAEAIQGFMSSVCSEWGNEISMKRFLTKEFNEKFYFPIESNDENLDTKDPKAQQSDLYRLLNISATKPLTPGANNEVIIRNIFDVFTNHSSDMARLNAFGMALLDYMKWLNYREKSVNEENGQIKVRGVRKAMERAYGEKAKSYVINLIKDINGRHNDNGDNPFLMQMLRFGKTAAVGSNLRVAFLQFTSYARASMVLSNGSLAKGLTKLPQIEKAKKYCGIALWKSFGFYDTNIARSIEDQIKGATNIRQKIIELSMKAPEWADAITWGALWNACEYEVAKTTKNKVGSEKFYEEVGKKLREVVYSTQVVDSVLTRSQIMRSKSGLTQLSTAYMSEPTLTANIVMDAGFQFIKEKRITGSPKTAWKKTGKIVGHAVGNYCTLALLTALAESLADAWRDDDDEEFGEKFWEAFKENAITNLNPFNKLPIISDIAEAIASVFGIGYFESGNMAFDWLEQATDALNVWSEVLGEKFGGEETSKTVYNAIYTTAKALSSVTGISVSGAMREVVTLWNNTAGAYDSTLKIRTYESTNAELGKQLYDAIVEGDDRQAESLKAQFDDPKAITSAIRKALRENDPRIKEAAQADFDGDIEAYNQIINEIIGEGNFDKDDILAAVKSERNDLEPDEEEDDSPAADKEVSIYNVEHYFTAIKSGKTSLANAAKADIIKTSVANGATAKEAEKAFLSDVRSLAKKAYAKGDLTRSEGEKLLANHPDPDEDNKYWVYWELKEWDYNKQHGTLDGYSKYNNFYEAVRTGKNLKAVISEHTSHGDEAKTLASRITTYFKPLYKEMSNPERSEIKGYLLNAYVLLGYSRVEKNKDINAWLKEKD